ncbi:MAG: N-acetylmuramoyl-L-alanine amidase [Prevotella sp.]|nr:N-acetylmuramoyl-L-alanine amidase [Prevotella sp.]
MTPIKEVRYIVVHCSGNSATSKLRAAQIRLFHMVERGFSDIGYHYVIPTDGTIELGRKCNIAGAHVKGYNQYSIGICYVGGLGADGAPADTRNAAQRKSLDKLIAELHATFPKALICGHRDFPGVTKQCPCFDVMKEFERYNKEAKYTLP